MDVIHTWLANWLNKNSYKIVDGGSIPDLIGNIEAGYIYWQRKGKTNEFWLSESINFKDERWFDKKELMPVLEKYSKKVKQKNSQYKFVLKTI